MRKLLIFLFNFFMHVSFLFARAGGGGGFSSGGGGGSFSGGSSGSGDGLGYLIYILIRLTFQNPLIGIPIDIGIGILIYYSYKTSYSANQGRVIRKAVRVSRQSGLNDKLGAFSAKDTFFSQEDFLKRVENNFISIQKSWSKGNVDDVRVLMSDGVFERFDAYLSMQKASNLINIVENIKVLSSSIVAIETTEFFDTMHVCIKASAEDYFLNTDNDKLVFGNKNPSCFTEYWSFIRRPGAKTENKPGLTEGNCPNCGTPLRMSDSLECPSCKAIVNSGEYDWILAEITQESEWFVPNETAIPGLIDMTKKDPGFCVQYIEDKVSVAFWRLRQGEFFADDRYVSKHLLKSFKNKIADNFYTTNSGEHSFYQDAAVGSVEIKEIKLANEDENFDKVFVLVKWSGHKEEKEVPSLIIPEWNKSKLMRNIFVFVRDKNVKSETKRGMLSSHCMSCGAPESLGLLGDCSFCGATQNDGSTGWVLEAIESAAAYDFKSTIAAKAFPEKKESTIDFENTLMTSSTLSPNQYKDLLGCLTAIMVVDGNIDQKELKLLESVAEAKGYSKTDLEMIINSVQTGTIQPKVPRDVKQGKDFFRLMVRMCLMDGKVTAKEKSLLLSLTSKLGYSEIDLGYMIKHEKGVLYREAKKYLQKK